MYLVFKEVNIFKETVSTGYISIVYADKKNTNNDLSISGISFDVNNTANIVSCFQVHGKPIVGGYLFETIKKFLIAKFMNIFSSDKLGLYRFNVAENKITRVGE